jgi:hypothetical protein
MEPVALANSADRRALDRHEAPFWLRPTRDATLLERPPPLSAAMNVVFGICSSEEPGCAGSSSRVLLAFGAVHSAATDACTGPAVGH